MHIVDQSDNSNIDKLLSNLEQQIDTMVKKISKKHTFKRAKQFRFHSESDKITKTKAI